MPNDKIVRKIAVIFVADAVGFSKMMAILRTILSFGM